MAVASVNSSSDMSSMLRQLADKLGFANIMLRQVPEHSGYELGVSHHDGRMTAIKILDPGNHTDLIQTVYYHLTKLSAKEPYYVRPNEIDLRYRAIEGMNDVLAIRARAQANRQRFDTFVVTPEQRQLLMGLTDNIAATMSGDLLSLYGCHLKVEHQDAED